MICIMKIIGQMVKNAYRSIICRIALFLFEMMCTISNYNSLQRSLVEFEDNPQHNFQYNQVPKPDEGGK